MAQQQKWDQMKLKGPVRKAPPIAETRKKLCSEAPRNVQKELHQLLEEFSDLFLEQLPKGGPPKREVEFEIKLQEGVVPPNKPPYRLSPKEHDELQAQIDDLDAFVVVYLDNVLVFSQMLEDHIRHIRTALQKMRDAKFFAHLHKCWFFQEKVEYLGFAVLRYGVQPSPKMV